MKHARVSALIISALIAVGLALGLTASAGATPAHPAAAKVPAGITSVQTVVFDCPAQHALLRPKTFIITCADGYTYLGKLSWTSWTPGLASATGSLVENDCTPYCVDGHFHSYPAVVIFWGNTAVKNHPGEHCYTNMTVILTGSRPRYYDYVTHKWVTAPVTTTSTLLTSPGTFSPA